MEKLLKDYQNNVFKNSKAHETLNPHQAAMLDWATGLAGEVGEVLDIVKHYIFHKEILDRMNIAKELGDVLWYLAALTNSLDMDLETILQLNMAKLEHRYGGKGYDINKSAARHSTENKFTDTEIYKQLEAKINKKPYNNEPNETEPFMPNFIVVGPDGAGKTTFCYTLQEYLIDKGYTSVDIVKGLHSDPDKLDNGLKLLNRRGVIFDRFYYPDDFIYSEVKDREYSVGDDIFSNDLLTKILSNRKNIILYLTADLPSLVERGRKQNKLGEDDYITLNELEKVREIYDRWYYTFDQDYEHPCIKVDTTDTTPEIVLGRVLQALKNSYWIKF